MFIMIIRTHLFLGFAEKIALMNVKDALDFLKLPDTQIPNETHTNIFYFYCIIIIID